MYESFFKNFSSTFDVVPPLSRLKSVAKDLKFFGEAVQKEREIRDPPAEIYYRKPSDIIRMTLMNPKTSGQLFRQPNSNSSSHSESCHSN